MVEPIALKAIECIVIAEDLRFGVQFRQRIGSADPHVALRISEDPQNGIVCQAIFLGIVPGKLTDLWIETEQPVSRRGDPNTVTVAIGVLRPVRGLAAWVIRVN